jgi:hypothetical protein
MVLDSAAAVGLDEGDSAIADSEDEDALEIIISNGRGASRIRENPDNDSESLDRLHLHHLLQSVLQDAQTRLFFKAQAVVQSEIGHYVPRPIDLEYPDVLKRIAGGEHGELSPFLQILT